MESLADEERQVKLLVEYDSETKGHAIVCQGGGLLYDSDSLLHLTRRAIRRLARIHMEQPGIDYEAAEATLIAEGLYQPESEADNG